MGWNQGYCQKLPYSRYVLFGNIKVDLGFLTYDACYNGNVLRWDNFFFIYTITERAAHGVQGFNLDTFLSLHV